MLRANPKASIIDLTTIPERASRRRQAVGRIACRSATYGRATDKPAIA